MTSKTCQKYVLICSTNPKKNLHRLIFEASNESNVSYAHTFYRIACTYPVWKFCNNQIGSNQSGHDFKIGICSVITNKS